MSAALHPDTELGESDGLIPGGRWSPTGHARSHWASISVVPDPSDLEYVTTLGPWIFTRQTTMDGALVEEFYDLYRLAFDPLKKRSVARQVLTRAEFIAQMLDEQVVKYVARNASGQALGLTTLTNALESVPWISPDYFAERYPDHTARGAVYYLGFTLAHPSQRHLRFVETIIEVGMRSLALEHAVIAYDVCAYNNLELRFDERIANAIEKFPAAKHELLDTQSYSCITFG